METKANTEEIALIAESCEKADVSYLTAGFIRDKASMEQVKTRLDEVQKIRTACKLPSDCNDEGAATELATTYIKQGLSIEEVQDKLLARMANDDEDTVIVNTVRPDQTQSSSEKKVLVNSWN